MKATLNQKKCERISRKFQLKYIMMTLKLQAFIIITDIMSSLSRSFLCTSEDKCLVCGQDLNDDASQISKRGWDTF